ncbi:MAG: CoA pyrophosphatase, partial [Myxococcota bacterium]
RRVLQLAKRDRPEPVITERQLRLALQGSGQDQRRREGFRYAAVAVVVWFPPRRGPEVLLIRRTEHPGDPWSGHMAFPGGREDASDVSLLQTATRETLEEVGLDLEATAEPLGRLRDVDAVARAKRINLVIAPHVFLLRTMPPRLVLDPREVAEALWTNLGPMYRGEVDTTTRYTHEGRPLDLPGFSVGDRVVWGLTHRMLELFFARLREGSCTR